VSKFNDEVSIAVIKIVKLCTDELLKESGDKRTTESALQFGRREIAKDILLILKDIKVK
tara:strand:+ start:425 stop:601 length:177 start_codon:yes stop_codon:yes gene_type:complete